jgi:prepilin-type N-terminal cleavage/methylation domain-containing protein
VKKRFPILDLRSPVENRAGKARLSSVENGFTLIEIMVVMALLSLIVIALMGVFNTTQTAFRASITQTDVLEGGRAAMDLIADDLRGMSPSLGFNNINNGAVNFYVTNNPNYSPLVQTLTASSGSRTNVQQNFFVLGRGNLNGVPTWYGTGYAVYVSPTNFYSLYRFSTNHPAAEIFQPASMFYNDFQNFLAAPNGYSHLLDGVVGFRVQAFDANGGLIITNLSNIRTNFLPNGVGHVGYIFYSNALPASVEIEMATLEDRTLQHAESIPSLIAQSNYLSQQSGKVHVFRQRISIPNVDRSAYNQ